MSSDKTRPQSDQHADLVARIMAAYPSVTLAAATQKLMLEKLRLFPISRARAGIEQMIEKRTSRFFPTISEILAYIRAVPVVPAQRGDPEPSPWVEAKSGICRCGVLEGEPWTREDLINPETGKIGLPNRLFQRACDAMDRKMGRPVGSPPLGNIGVPILPTPRDVEPDDGEPDWA